MPSRMGLDDRAIVNSFCENAPRLRETPIFKFYSLKLETRLSSTRNACFQNEVSSRLRETPSFLTNCRLAYAKHAFGRHHRTKPSQARPSGTQKKPSRAGPGRARSSCQLFLCVGATNPTCKSSRANSALCQLCLIILPGRHVHHSQTSSTCPRWRSRDCPGPGAAGGRRPHPGPVPEPGANQTKVTPEFPRGIFVSVAVALPASRQTQSCHIFLYIPIYSYIFIP